MEVSTATERLRRYRRQIVELLFAERNHVCAVCVANGHCELQAVALRGRDGPRPLPVPLPAHRARRHAPPLRARPRALHPLHPLRPGLRRDRGGAHLGRGRPRGAGARHHRPGRSPGARADSPAPAAASASRSARPARSSRRSGPPPASARTRASSPTSRTRGRQEQCLSRVSAGTDPACYAPLRGATGPTTWPPSGWAAAPAATCPSSTWTSGCSTWPAKMDLVYSPIVDVKVFPEDVDVALVEGAVRQRGPPALAAQTIRAQHAGCVVAFGDCAVTGNVTAIRNALGSAAAGAGPGLPRRAPTCSPASRRAPASCRALLDRVLPLHQVIAGRRLAPRLPPARRPHPRRSSSTRWPGACRRPRAARLHFG